MAADDARIYAMDAFEVEVNCSAGPHSHKIVVGHGPGAYGVSQPANVRLQYTCPITGVSLVATFTPPVGVGRPFSVVKVT
jgi:ethanolamine utilization protein EutA (predicted chaperonin)